MNKKRRKEIIIALSIFVGLAIFFALLSMLG